MKGWLIYLNFVIPWLPLFVPKGTIQIVTLTVAVPVGLLVFNCVLFFSRIETSILRACTFMLAGLLLPMLIHYVRLAMKGKTWFPLDAEALWIIEALVKYYVGLTIGLFLITQVGRLLIYLFRRKS